MVQLLTGIYGWQAQTRAIEDISNRKNGFLRSFLFGDSFNTNATESLSVTVYRGERAVSPFVKRGAPAQILRGLGEETQTITPPQVRNKMEIEPFKYLRTAPLGVSSLLSGASQEAAIKAAAGKKINRDLTQLANYADNMEEVMVGMMLGDSSGAAKISYTVAMGGGEGADVYELTYPRSAANFIDITVAGEQWDNVAMPDPADVIETAKARLATVGLVATDVIMGSNVASAFSKSTAVTKNLDYRRMLQAGPIPLGGDFSRAGLEGAVWKGSYAGLDWRLYNRTVTMKGIDGSDVVAAHDIIDPDSCYVVSRTPAAEFVMEYGGILEMDVLQGASMAQRRFVKSWVDDGDSSSAWSMMVSHPLPVPYQVDSVVQIQPLA